MAGQGNQIDVVGNTYNEPIDPEIRERFTTDWDLASERAAVVVSFLQDKGVAQGEIGSCRILRSTSLSCETASSLAGGEGVPRPR